MLKRMLPCALWIVASALIIEAGSPIARFSRPANAAPFGITLSTDPAAPNGDLWFTEFDANRVVRFSGGTFLEYPMPAGSGPQGIAMGPGGRGLANRPLWIALNTSSRIGRLLPGGAFTATPTPTPNSGPTALTVGGDDVWFTEANVNRIARVSAGGQLPTGAIEEFPVPTPNSRPHGIVFHPPTGLWFTEFDPGIASVTSSPWARRSSSSSSRRRTVAGPHHRRPRRQPVVHRVRRQQNRAHHDSGHDHRIPAADAQQRSVRDCCRT